MPKKKKIAKKNDSPKTEINPNGAGRPRAKIDKDKFVKLLELGCRLKDIRYVFDCSEDTVERYCKREYGLKFADLRALKSSRTDIGVLQQMYRKCEQGDNTMLIWWSKNRMGWADKQETKQEIKLDNRVVYFPDNGREPVDK